LRFPNRPEECINHSFPYSVCPIGIDVLKITTPEEKHKRIDRGYELLNKKFKRIIKI
jgi:hypothetical protein